ncbi:MAG: Maf-like protein [Bacteroidaceae bacterium]|jgi:septum formation protein
MFSLGNYRLVLASNSPRRKELLKGLCLPYEVRTLPGIDESYPHELRGADIPLYIACKKAEAYRDSLQADELLLTADTIVWIDGEVLGKPADASDAVRMLRTLSGRTHQVFTGACLTTTERQKSFSCRTDVTFAELEEDEIEWYVEHFRPFDKAGSYGVQEWIGYIGCSGMQGSFYNVMGLPVQRLYQELKQWFA